MSRVESTHLKPFFWSEDRFFPFEHWQFAFMSCTSALMTQSCECPVGCLRPLLSLSWVLGEGGAWFTFNLTQRVRRQRCRRSQRSPCYVSTSVLGVRADCSRFHQSGHEVTALLAQLRNEEERSYHLAQGRFIISRFRYHKTGNGIKKARLTATYIRMLGSNVH
eukprot:3594286-Amphidinium_carterae.3